MLPQITWIIIAILIKVDIIIRILSAICKKIHLSSYIHLGQPVKHTASHKKIYRPTRYHPFYAVLFLFFLLLLASPACADKILIIGDTQYAIVADVVSGIQASIRSQSKGYATSEVKGRLGTIVEREDASIVVALGMEAAHEALRLPSSISVVYGLVAAPLRTGRPHVTGVYMSPPVREYVAMLRNYLPELSKFSVVGSQNMIKSLVDSDSFQVSTHNVSNSSDLVNTVNQLRDIRALLLLPDANLLTAPVVAKVLLHSFKNNIPLLGISEAHVKQGALLALVFDHKAVSHQIGAKVQSILNGMDAEESSASPPNKYNLYINNNTARKMGIEIPDAMTRMARKIY